MNKQLFRNLTKYSIALLYFICTIQAHALTTDKNQDIEIESDTVYLDDTKSLGIYNGNVVIVQGSIRITGDKLTVFYTTENELEKIIVEGLPATFRQLPDNSEVYDEAEALVMEYQENISRIILTKKAKVKQGERRLLAEHIEYDTELSQVRAKGGTPVDNTNQDTRVKLIIPGKKDNPEPTK
jgi:lipopolysaccharide export system protein LptA